MEVVSFQGTDARLVHHLFPGLQTLQGRTDFFFQQHLVTRHLQYFFVQLQDKPAV